MLMARSGMLAMHNLGCMWTADAAGATAGDQCQPMTMVAVVVCIGEKNK